ncbi:triacylglycerol lipase 2-like isoform X2 [Panicum hallii]|uniref:triacylglycerol lipase 2-like isoform X2 n=1 Tax=Panicum hallii TaxID=206008 RepID=UPI000DF4E92D|nr:triacylglycerol lipase 2-like isoform X2 [Panicum hallii]
MAWNLYLLCFLILFISLNRRSVLSWRIQNSTDDQCPLQPHPLGMCKARLAAYGYPCEEYQVTTEDGYILSLKRIPHGLSNADNSTEDRTPVLLFHGLMVDGFCWLLSTPKQSLGFILADAGFDVWIANCRGTKSSRKHTSLTPEDPAFWDFSWDELAAYDLPAVLQFVYNQTGGKKVHYVGHSLGTLIILAAFSEHKLIDIVRSAVLLCPIAYLHRTKSRLILLAARIFLAETIHMLGFHEFNPVGRVAQEVLGQVCTDPEVDCYDLFAAVAVVRKAGVRRYDYGNEKENMKHYNQPEPPMYNLSSIPTHVPLFLTHGGQDFLGDVLDTRHLLRTLVREHDSDDIEVLYMPDYAHGDFVMGYNAPQLIYKPIVEFFERH